MIGMLMGVEHRMDQRYLLAKQLHAQIRWRIDQQVALRQAQDRARAGPLIARMTAGTHRTIATDARNADTRAGPEQHQGTLDIACSTHKSTTGLYIPFHITARPTVQFPNIIDPKSATMSVRQMDSPSANTPYVLFGIEHKSRPTVIGLDIPLAGLLGSRNPMDLEDLRNELAKR